MSYNEITIEKEPSKITTTNEEYGTIKLVTKYLKMQVDIKRYAFIATKRAFDIICSLIGCILLVPIAIIIKIVYIMNGDFDKIIYSQNRIGLNGKEFKLYKFRTMVPKADEILAEMLSKDKELEKEYKKKMKLENDPRITKARKDN